MLPNTAIKRKETKGKKEGNISYFSKSESAASTVIAAVLLFALIFTVISIVKLEHVPEWKNDAERDHMYDIWDDMAGVKTRIDMLSKLMESRDYSAYGFSVTVPFNTGGGKVPIFESSKSDGRLEVNTERCAMTIEPLSTTQKVNPYTFECGGITCYLENRQYTNQIIRYENGALILADGKSSLMKQPPAFYIMNKTGNYTIQIHAVQFLGKPHSVSSNTIVPLRLTGWGVNQVHNSQNYENLSTNSTNITGFNLTVATKYPDAWIAYFNEIAKKEGFDPENDYKVQNLPKSKSVRFCFHPIGNKNLEKLIVSKSVIGAELGAETKFNYANYGSLAKVMKLNQWYNFNKVSNGQKGVNPYQFSNYGSATNFSLDTNNEGEIPSDYIPNQNFTYDVKNSHLNLMFSFNGYATFESKPALATIRMIYRYDFDSPSSNLRVADNNTSYSLNGTKDKWYLYNKTTAVNITNPSELIFYMNVSKSSGGGSQKNMTIDYLEVRLN